MKDYGSVLDNSYIDEYDKHKYITVFSNVVVARGGDGTLIKAIHREKHRHLPFYGLQGGTVGFMMNKKLKNISHCEVVKLKMIKIKVKTKTYTKTYEAFNDVSIGGDPRLWIEFKVKEKDDVIGTFKGSGMIVSTPQGSTAINKTNGGSILPLKANLWSITGDKTERDIDFVLKPRKMKITFTSRTSVPVLIDGTNKIIDDALELTIEQGSEIELLFSDYKSFIKKRRI